MSLTSVRSLIHPSSFSRLLSISVLGIYSLTDDEEGGEDQRVSCREDGAGQEEEPF